MNPQHAYAPYGAPIREKRMLPVQPPTQVIGRNKDLAALHIALKARSAVLLSGMSGIGKSALAAVLATAQIASNPGGVLWFHLQEDDLRSLLARIGRAYGADTFTGNDDGVQKNAAAVRDLLQKQRPMIVLDGVVDLDAAKEFVRVCAQGIPIVIIADRNVGGPWTPVYLTPLSSADAQMVYRHYAGLTEPIFNADVEALAKFTGGYPLALELAGRLAAAEKLTPAETLSALQATAAADSQQVVIGSCFKRLDGAAQGVLMLLSAMPTGSAGIELLSSMAKMPPPEVLQQTRKLSARGFVREYIALNQGRFGIHEQIQQYARNWLRSYQRLRSAEDRGLQGILAYTEHNAKNTAAAHDRLAGEIDNIVGAAAYAVNTDRAPMVKRLISALEDQADDFILERNFWLELDQLKQLVTVTEPLEPVKVTPSVKAVAPPPPPELPAQRRAVKPLLQEMPTDPTVVLPPPPGVEPELPAIEATPTPPASLPRLGLFSGGTPKPAAPSIPADVPPQERAPLPVVVSAPADLPEASDEPVTLQTPPSIETLKAELDAARKRGDSQREGALLQGLGQSALDVGHLDDAISYFTQSISAYEIANDRAGVAAGADTLAGLLQFKGEARSAVSYAQRALNAAEKLGDRMRMGRAQSRLADVRLALGETESAFDLYNKAVGTLRELGDMAQAGNAMSKLGGAYLQLGRFQEAAQTLEPALDIFRQENRLDQQLRVLSRLGTAYTRLRQWQKAETYHEQAQLIAKDQLDMQLEGEQLAAVGYLRELLNDREGAILYYRRALHVAYQIGDSKLQAAYAVQLAEYMIDDVRTLQQAIQLLQEANTTVPSAEARRLLSRADQRLKRSQTAGVQIPPAMGSNKDFAARAYVA